MAVQDVAELIPRVRRALEGPVTQSGGLTDPQVTAVTADAIADIILLTAGEWNHTLAVSGRDPDSNVPTAWTVDPELRIEEETVVASQAALTYFFHTMKDMKVSETITNEGQTWTWEKSANVLRDWVKLLQDMRDRALEALEEEYPVLVRVASILAVRDRVGAVMLEPWVAVSDQTAGLGLGGGMEQWLGPVIP